MVDIPADAPRSEDGYYWWDGSQWQPVDQSQGQTQGQAQDPAQGQAQDQSQGGQTAQAGAQQMTNDLFANMMQAAASEIQEV